MNPSRTASAPISNARPYQSPASKQPPAFPAVQREATPPPQPKPLEVPPGVAPSSTPEFDSVWAGLLEFTDSLPPSIRAWALDLWDDIAVGQVRPPHMRRDAGPTIALGAAFQGSHKPVFTKKRELHHQVRGVLSKASPENYDKVQQQLLDLPIRQSEADEIDKVVQVFFVKATDPSERLYAAFYARCFKALLDYIRDEEEKKNIDVRNVEVSAYRRLKKSLLSKLQQLYDRSDMLDELKNGDSMSDEVRTLKLSEFKANISFLGELFLVDLVLEKLVNHVLFKLLFPGGPETPGGPPGVLPKDYEVDQFFALLRVVGHRTTQDGVRRYTDQYIERCNQLEKEHPVKRTQFKVMDIRDMITNGYVAKSAAAQAMSKEDVSKAKFKSELSRAEQRADGPGPSSHHQRDQQARPAPPLRAAPTGPAEMDANMFIKVAIAPSAFGDEPQYFSTLRTLPHASVERFYEHMVHEFMRPNNQYDQGRRMLGKLSTQFVERGIFTREKVIEMFNKQIVKFVEDDYVSDSPRCVEYLVQFVTSGREADWIFGLDSFTTFLSALVGQEHSKSKDYLKHLVGAAAEQLEKHGCKDAMNWSVENRRRLRRFRLLPVLLRCTHDGDDDFLDEFSKCEGPATRDVTLFAGFSRAEICIPLWEKQLKEVTFDIKTALPIVRVDDYWRLQVVSSLFTFVRFDKNVLEKFVAIFEKAFRSQDFKKIMPTVLVEIYETWVDLGRTPKSSLFDFYSKLNGCTKTLFFDLQKYVRDVAGDEEVANMLKKLS